MAIPYYNILNMFGGSGFGCLSSYGNFGSLGGFGMGGSLFTNCLGDFDYDAAAGYGVANAVLGVAGMAINQSVSNKRAAKAEHENNKAEIENIDKQISSKTATKNNLTNENTSLLDDVNTAKSNSEELGKQINTKKATVDNLKAEYDRLIKDDTQKEAQTNALKEWNAAKDELEELEKEKAAQDKIVKDNNNKIEANKKEIQKLDNDIKDLEAKKAKLQEAVENVDLDKADGTKLTRTSDEKYAEKLVDGKVDKSKSYTEKDIRTAIMHFSKEIDGTPEKLQKAQNVYDMYSCIPESDKNSTMKRAVEIAYNYIKEHKTEE